MIRELQPLDDRIVLFGQSCVGKTTFAEALSSHRHYCFDSMFHWWTIESLGLPVDVNLQEVSKNCTAEKFVLDGWTLADESGDYLPLGAKVYVIYAPYEQIISQYRIPVGDPEEFRLMFNKWYGVNYKTLGARYFRNEGLFVETGEEEFYSLLKM